MDKRIESVWIGKDNELLDTMFEFYIPEAHSIVDVACNNRRMWKKSQWANKVLYCDIKDYETNPDILCNWSNMPFKNKSIDVLVYDPPHLPIVAASKMSMPHYIKNYGLKSSSKEDNIRTLHYPFLVEAKRVLKFDGLIFAKIKDYIHNHRYQWNLSIFNEEVKKADMVPCDLIIKRDPCGGNLKSGRWKKAHHAKNVHCYWVIIRNSKRCEPNKSLQDKIKQGCLNV